MDDQSPSPVWILGQRFTIDPVEADIRDNTLGECDVNKSAITYWKGSSHDSARDTVFHEILHAIFFLMSLNADDCEEETVTRMSTGLTCILRDPRNREFVAWYLA